MKFVVALLLSVASAADPVVGDACDESKLAHVCGTATGADALRCATAGENKGKCIKQQECNTMDSRGGIQSCATIGSPCNSTDPTKSKCADTYSCAAAPADWNSQCVPTKACTEQVDGIQVTCAADAKGCDSTKAASGCPKNEQCATAPAEKKNKCVADQTCNTGTGAFRIECPVVGASCDPASLNHVCTKTARCATAGEATGRCILNANCGQPDSKAVKQTCTEIGKTCDSTKDADKSDCADSFTCANGPSDWTNECVPTKACSEKVDNIQVTCKGIKPAGGKCDSTKPDSGCATGQQCATGPDATKNTCVGDDQCGTGTGDAKITCGSLGAPCDADQKGKGCADGFRCATAPDALKNRCVTKEACDQKTGDVTTTCGAKVLAASLIAAFTIVTTM